MTIDGVFTNVWENFLIFFDLVSKGSKWLPAVPTVFWINENVFISKKLNNYIVLSK